MRETKNEGGEGVKSLKKSQSYVWETKKS